MDNAAVTAEEERSTLKQKVRGAACRFSCQRGGSFCMLRAKNEYYYNISRTLYAPCFILSH